ncbi:MAG: Kelch repeat-containing protein [Chthoniobacterales bacterium]
MPSNPSTQLFHTIASLNTGRALHTANLLNNGKVVLIGGAVVGGDETATAELYDPATGMFTYTGSLMLKRKRHTATLLPDGTVLATGGDYLKNQDGGNARETNTAEVYNSATGTFSSVQNMKVARADHTATLLPDSTVLIAGGVFRPAVSELYHPTLGTFSSVGQLIQARGRHVSILLSNPAWGSLVGQVLVIGGDVTGGAIFGGAQQALDSVEIYDPATASFSYFGTMTVARQNHTAIELPDGRILIAGGIGRPFVSNTAEIVTP